MSEYKPTIGLEIHAELATESKMFCGCKNDSDEKKPNVNICPVCMAHPGTLPVINMEAVKSVLRVGLALGSQLADYTEWNRKNYFYPDIPKGYQISQYKFPLVSGGELKGVKITRVHLEEDTARSQHGTSRTDLDIISRSVLDESLIDYNRAGVPLMELVTEPVITSAKQAGDFARELQLVLRYLGVAEANMEKGEMRVEANVSVSKTDKFGTKTEVKNINSFRAVEKAIEYEIKRQIEVLESGGAVVQETRGWDDGKSATFSQRKKESSHDYRYFPDPDLPKMWVSKITEFKDLKNTIPELPEEKRERYRRLGFLQDQDIEQLVGDFELANLFDQVAIILNDQKMIKTTANFILNDIAGQRKKDTIWRLPDAAYLAEVARKYHEGIMASPQAKRAILSGTMVAAVDDTALPELVQKVIVANPKVVAEYKVGKLPALQFLVGQGMKESKGSANPEVLKKLFTEALK